MGEPSTSGEFRPRGGDGDPAAMAMRRRWRCGSDGGAVVVVAMRRRRCDSGDCGGSDGLAVR
jgi:hypothetical protein